MTGGFMSGTNPGQPPSRDAGQRRSRLSSNLALLREDPRTLFQKVATWLRPMERTYRRRWSYGIRKWMIDYHTQTLFRKVSWMGVEARKMVLDAWVYQDIIHETRPDFIIEIGNKVGGSTLYLAHLLDILGHGQVIGVDIDHSDFQPRHPRIHLVTGDSTAPETLARVEELAAGRQGMIIHDGDHSTAHVLEDLRAYAKFVAMGGYFIVEDTVIDVFRAGDGLGNINGPMHAVRQFLQEDSRFEIDPEREYFLVTYNPRGYLKRIR
jgi:cephalosporin hydroxylase